MATIEWFRLWHDMPNDPKWRTIARASGQPIHLVLSVALHLMVDASRNVTRGHVTVTEEDVASALDVTNEAVEAIFSAMQGRVLDGDRLSGWEKRQPKREDSGNPETGAKSAAERKRAQREREKSIPGSESEEGVTRSHETSRTDTDTEKSKEEPPIPPKGGNGPEETGESEPPEATGAGKPARRAAIALKTFLAGCREAGEKPIAEDDPVFDYAVKTGIPIDVLRLHWLEFKARYSLPDAKRYKDWRTVYRKSVRGNWFRLWFLRADGTCGLTTQGEQARREHQQEAA
ncbi:hypothetical protein [Burkholderia glumae]|uniref:hypothetical protein n=1 Tax=Burkholderia glumae TaxID=337 RepID=UPI002151551A|nr:hypothetical protein [Burkholderia glumae]